MPQHEPVVIFILDRQRLARTHRGLGRHTVIHRGGGREHHRQTKGGQASGGGDRQVPVHRPHDPARQGQPQPGAGQPPPLRLFPTLETGKNGLLLLRRQIRPRVCHRHRERQIAVFPNLPGQLHLGHRWLAVLQGVGHQIGDHLPQLAHIAFHPHGRGHEEVHPRQGGIDRPGRPLDGGHHVEHLRVKLQLAPVDPRKIQHIIEDAPQLVGAALQRFHEQPLPRPHGGFVEHVAEADHPVERVADLVADRGEENLAGLQGLVQRQGALVHQPLQFPRPERQPVRAPADEPDHEGGEQQHQQHRPRPVNPPRAWPLQQDFFAGLQPAEGFRHLHPGLPVRQTRDGVGAVHQRHRLATGQDVVMRVRPRGGPGRRELRRKIGQLHPDLPPACDPRGQPGRPRQADAQDLLRRDHVEQVAGLVQMGDPGGQTGHIERPPSAVRVAADKAFAPDLDGSVCPVRRQHPAGQRKLPSVGEAQLVLQQKYRQLLPPRHAREAALRHRRERLPIEPVKPRRGADPHRLPGGFHRVGPHHRQLPQHLAGTIEVGQHRLLQHHPARVVGCESKHFAAGQVNFYPIWQHDLPPTAGGSIPADKGGPRLELSRAKVIGAGGEMDLLVHRIHILAGQRQHIEGVGKHPHRATAGPDEEALRSLEQGVGIAPQLFQPQLPEYPPVLPRRANSLHERGEHRLVLADIKTHCRNRKWHDEGAGVESRGLPRGQGI